MKAASTQRSGRWLIVAGCCCLQMICPAATRVAIVGADAGVEAGKVLDLAIAEFKDSQDIAVLERAQIDRVWREQELSLGNQVPDAERAVQAGRLLRVDLFAVLEGGGPQQPFGIVVFDAHTGVRYADSAVAAPTIFSAARGMAKVIEQAAGKSRRRSTDLLTVGVLSVRNADLARSFDPLCDSVALLLERELVGAPGVAVLERRRLEHINRERGVVDDASSALRPSWRMLDLEIARNGQGLRGSVAVTSFDGQATARTNASVATMNVATLARRLAEALTQLLQNQSLTVQPDRFAEARRFGREGELLQAQQDYAAAARAMEAAYALDPANQAYACRLVQLFPDAAIEIIDPGGQRWHRRLTRKLSEDELSLALSLGQRGADLLRDSCQQAAASTKSDEPYPDIMSPTISEGLWRMIEKLADPTLRGHSAQAKIESLYRIERDVRLEILEPFYRARVRDQKSFDRFSWNLFPFALNDRLGAFDRGQWQRDAVLVAERWLEVAKKLNPPDGSGNYAPLFYLTHGGLPSAATQAPELFAPFWTACENADDPVLRAYGKFGPAMREIIATKRADIEMERRLRLSLQGEMERLSGPKTNARPKLFGMIEQALLAVANHPQYGEECVAACRFALQQRAARPVLFKAAIPFFSGAEDRSLASDISRMITERPKEFPDLERNQIANLCHLYEERFAQSAPAQSSPVLSLSAVKLFEPSPQRDGMGWLLKVFAADGVAYVAGLGLDDLVPETETIQLIRVPLDGKPVSRLGRAPFRGLVMPQIHRSAESAWRRGAARISSIQLQAANLRFAACAAVGKVFVATHLGVFIFSTNGGTPELLCGTNGLPSDDVHSLAFLHGKLYIGAGELKRAGYLAEYDPATKAVRTLASSRRKEAGSPFDDQMPFFPAFLWADEARGRVLMLAGTTTSNSLSGWWAFTPATGQFQQLAHLRTRLLTTYSLWGGEAEPGILAAFSDQGITMWDAQSDKFAFQYKRINEESSPFWPARKQGSMIVLHPPLLRHDGWFWWANPLQRVSLDGQKIESFPPVPGRDEKHRIECLQFLDGGQRMLAADRSGVWLLELSPAASDREKNSTPASMP